MKLPERQDQPRFEQFLHFGIAYLSDLEMTGKVSPGALGNLRRLLEDQAAFIAPTELLQIIDAARWDGLSLWQLESPSNGSYGEWQGKGADLECLLASSTMAQESVQLLSHHPIERLLTKLKEDPGIGGRVDYHRTSTARRWIVRRMTGVQAEMTARSAPFS